MTEQVAQDTFLDLGVAEPIAEALASVGIIKPFPIQALAIPLALSGTDLIGQARTGTGKTLAFGTVLLHRLQALAETQQPQHGKPRGIVICPTRELAVQVGRDIETASSKLKTRILTIYGGTGYDDQLHALERGVDVVVGTPGRLLDLIQRRALDLSKVQVLVLDEADEMLDLGFLPDVERILDTTPKSRQTMLFSATMPGQILSLARARLNRPINIRAEGEDAQATVPDTTQFIYQSHHLDKPEVVARIIQADDAEKVMVFTRTKREAQRLADDLVDRGFPAASIHGDLNQAARERSLRKFRKGIIRVLVATDVAARGIDVTGVSHVINYECPDTDATYIHRIGRTGRAGRKGVAVTLVDWADVHRWKLIDKALDLGNPNPVETYSSSPHLYTDLGIPEGTKGRIGKPKPKHNSEAHDKDGEEKHRQHRERRRAERSSKPRRRRRRVRAGVEVTRPEPTDD